MQIFKLLIFSINLFLILLVSSLRLIWFYFKKTVIEHRLSLLIYCLVFIQLLLLAGQIISIRLPSYQKIYPKKNNEFIKKTIDLSQVNLYTLKTDENKIKDELMKYQMWQVRQSSHRDVLLNQALLQLSLGNNQKFEELIKQAKQTDPNWVGWK